jgi:hypothetical protein
MAFARLTRGLDGHAVAVLLRDVAMPVGIRRFGRAEAGVDMAAECIVSERART